MTTTTNIVSEHTCAVCPSQTTSVPDTYCSLFTIHAREPPDRLLVEIIIVLGNKDNKNIATSSLRIYPQYTNNHSHFLKTNVPRYSNKNIKRKIECSPLEAWLN